MPTSTGLGDLIEGVGLEGAPNGGLVTVQGASGFEGLTPYATASGNIAGLNQSVSISCSGRSAILIDVAGAWVATLNFRASFDGGATYVSLGTYAPQPIEIGTSVFGNATTVNTRRVFYNVAGWTHFQVIAVLYTSGTANITLVAQAGINRAVTLLAQDGQSFASVSLMNADAVSAVTGALNVNAAGYFYNGTSWDRARGDITKGQAVSTAQASLAARGDSAANTAQTVTIAASGAGIFHYIDYLYLGRTATAALAGTGRIQIQTSNLGLGAATATWSVGNAVAAGETRIDVDQTFPIPWRSAVANTATSIIFPACGAAVLSTILIVYHTGP